MGFLHSGWKPAATLTAGVIATAALLAEGALLNGSARGADANGGERPNFLLVQYQGQQSSGNAPAGPASPPKSRRGANPGGQAIWPGASIVRAAFAKTKTAATEEEYNAILDDCHRGLDRGLDGGMTVYTRRLMAWTHNRRGELRVDAGRQQEALEDFEAAVSLDDTKWRPFHNRGVVHATLGQYDKAIADFNRTLKMNPGYANAYFNRGELRYEKHDFVGAIGDYTQAIHLAPNDSGAYNSRGHAHYRLHEFREALADYHQAIRLDPENAAAFTNRGDMFADFGRWANASSDYRMAIKLNPALGRAYQSAAWLMATCPEEDFRNPDQALEAAERAIKIDGDGDYRYLETLAAAEANAGHFADAIGTQERAISITPVDYREHATHRLNLYQHEKACREAPHTATPTTVSRSAHRSGPPPLER